MVAIEVRFKEELCGDLILEIKNLKQQDSLAYYFRRFDALLNIVQQVENVSKNSALSLFIGGLGSSFYSDLNHCMKILWVLNQSRELLVVVLLVVVLLVIIIARSVIYHWEGVVQLFLSANQRDTHMVK